MFFPFLHEHHAFSCPIHAPESSITCKWTAVLMNQQIWFPLFCWISTKANVYRNPPMSPATHQDLNTDFKVGILKDNWFTSKQRSVDLFSLFPSFLSHLWPFGVWNWTEYCLLCSCHQTFPVVHRRVFFQICSQTFSLQSLKAGICLCCWIMCQ